MSFIQPKYPKTTEEDQDDQDQENVVSPTPTMAHIVTPCNLVCGTEVGPYWTVGSGQAPCLPTLV
jgi:hypothetical protein